MITMRRLIRRLSSIPDLAKVLLFFMLIYGCAGAVAVYQIYLGINV